MSFTGFSENGQTKLNGDIDNLHEEVAPLNDFMREAYVAMKAICEKHKSIAFDIDVFTDLLEDTTYNEFDAAILAAELDGIVSVRDLYDYKPTAARTLPRRGEFSDAEL